MSTRDSSSVLRRAPLFAANWALANQETQAAETKDFVLNDGTTRADFVAMTADLSALITQVQTDDNNLTLLRAHVENLRASTHEMMSDWRKKAASDVAGTPYGANLPTLPGLSTALDAFLKTLRLANDRWIQIDGAGTDVPHFTPPMIVKGTTQAQFQDAIGSLETSSRQLENADNALPGERAKRDMQCETVYQTETAYRKKVLADFPANSPALMTLPTLQPANHGSTPQAVELSGLYNAQTGQGDLSWTASSDAHLARYAVRICVGAKYKEADATLLAELAPGITNYQIDAQYLQPGAPICAVAVVIADDDHEKASNVVTLTAPLMK